MDTAIKQRILGGVVLLAGAAIFLPLMLDGTGAKLLSRLESIPAQPAMPNAEKASPNLDAQSQSAEQAVDAAHEDSTEFYPVGEPVAGDPASAAEGSLPPAGLAKTPEQQAAEEAARKRAMDLLNSVDEISPEEAALQQRSADKLSRELAGKADSMASAAAQTPDATARKADEDRARAILEARTSTEQKLAEEKAKADRLKSDADAAKARELKLAQDKTVADKARAEQLAADKPHADKPVQERKAQEDKARADKAAADKKLAEDKLKAEKQAADKRLADEKAKAEKLKSDKSAAEEKAKAEKLAEEKAKAKKLEEQKAKVALEGKAKTEVKADSNPVGGSQAWVVQAGSFSDKAKATELSGKLKGKGFRSQVVKSGDAWKVVVGPELDKNAAKALSGRLNGEAGVSGAWVAPWKP